MSEQTITGDETLRGVFAPDFLNGAATASYQIEGAYNVDGKALSNWDHFMADKLENGNDAVMSYKYWREDVALLKRYGMNAYRFSISWSRVKPLGGKDDPVNEKGIEYYSNLIDELIANGIEPCVTLFHWDLPLELDKRYGGFNCTEKVVPDFVAYARLCFERFGDRVKTWMTINEHNFEPNDFSEAKYVAYTKSILLSHARTVDLYRREFTREGSKIGIALNIDWMVPLDDSPAARKAADIGISHWLGMYADPIYYGEFPSTCIERFGPTLSLTAEEWALVKGSTDFFGLNHYSTSYTTGELIPYESANGVERCFGLVRTTLEKDGVPIGPTGQNNHPIQVPWGFRQLVQHVHKRYIAPSGQRLYITENGFATKDEGERPLEQIIRDTERQAYYALYLRELAEAARDDGVNVGGYMAWSLLDNLEWTGGWAPRFGVTYVDRSTPEYKRIPKDSAFMLQRVFQHLVKKE